MKPETINDWESRLRSPPTKKLITINQQSTSSSNDNKNPTDTDEIITSLRRRSVPRFYSDSFIDKNKDFDADIPNIQTIPNNLQPTQDGLLIGVFAIFCLILFCLYRIQHTMKRNKSG